MNCRPLKTWRPKVSCYTWAMNKSLLRGATKTTAAARSTIGLFTKRRTKEQEPETQWARLTAYRTRPGGIVFGE